MAQTITYELINKVNTICHINISSKVGYASSTSSSEVIIYFTICYTVWMHTIWKYAFYKSYYYSFKIFPRFRFVKTTRIIHQNQLLFTKFGKNLCRYGIELMTSKVQLAADYWTDDVKMTSKVQPTADERILPPTFLLKFQIFLVKV